MQLRNFELEGKMEISKKSGPPSSSPGRRGMVCSSLLGGGGREGGGAPRELLPQGAAVPSLQRQGGPKDMPRAGRFEPHSPKTTSQGRKGWRARPPLSLSPPLLTRSGLWALGPGSFMGKKDSWLGLARSWTGHGLAPLHVTCIEALQVAHTDSDVPVEVDSVTSQDNTH